MATNKKIELDDLYESPERLREFGDLIQKIFYMSADNVEETLENLVPESIISMVLSGATKHAGSPAAAGARRSAVHPTQLDKDVCAWLFANKGEQRVADIKAAMSGDHPGIDSLEISKSLKFLVSTDQVGTNGKRGRGTAYYAVEGQPGVLPEATHDETRAPNGGPTARAAVLCVLNELPVGDKISPKNVFSRAMELFPNQFNTASFGGLFSQLSKESLSGLCSEGVGRSRVYYRTGELAGAVSLPEDAPPRTVASEENETNTEAATG